MKQEKMNDFDGRTLKIGLYGCNLYRTKEILDAAEQCYPGLIKITAGYDINREQVDNVAGIYGSKPCYDLLTFLKADFEVAVISLPPYLHPEAFTACAEAGKNIYLEKPVCVDERGKEVLIEAMNRYHPICYVGLSNQYIPPYRKALEIAHKAGGGKLLAIHHHWLKCCDGNPASLSNWRQKIEQSGGELNQHCCHVMHYFRLVGGEPESVSAMAYTSDSFQPAHEEEELTACFRFKEGIGVFNLSQRSHRNIQWGQIDQEHRGISYRWSGQAQTKVYTDRHSAAEEIYEWDMIPPPVRPEDSYTYLQLKDFLDAYMNGKPMPITLADGIQAYHMVAAIRKSYCERKEVAVPLWGSESVSQ